MINAHHNRRGRFIGGRVGAEFVYVAPVAITTIDACNVISTAHRIECSVALGDVVSFPFECGHGTLLDVTLHDTQVFEQGVQVNFGRFYDFEMKW